MDVSMVRIIIKYFMFKIYLVFSSQITIIIICRCPENEFLADKDELDKHHAEYHSHLDLDYKIVRRHFKCKYCYFYASNLAAMTKHADKHRSISKCKYCHTIFQDFDAIKNHFKLFHPTSDPETRDLTDYEKSLEIKKER